MGDNNIIIGSNVKQPYPGRNPTNSVITTSSHSNGIQQSEERGKEIYLPMMCRTEKDNIPLMGGKVPNGPP